jgi:DNA-binding LytR/AlgR family response regulator
MVVDDEPLARRVLEKYIDSLPSLELSIQCKNVMEVSAYLHENPVDVIFLDIKMPQLSGIDFLKTLDTPPNIIITTAFSEYALEGYEYSVIDYLLKPISFPRFLKAVNKIQPNHQNNSISFINGNQNRKNNFIFLHADKVDHKVSYLDIYYIEGCGNFINVHTKDQVLIVSEKMKTIEDTLPGESFIRVHKSFIVNIEEIEQIEGNMIEIHGRSIPIGRHYRINVERIIKKYRLNQ